MRLLSYEDGKFKLTETTGKDVPEYAILSHTWGPDDEEVTCEDIMKGIGHSKKGYRKLSFCQKQVATDNLAYFWVDTCCIEKSDSRELQQAINSMFKWYEKASRCYVLLGDVSAEDLALDDWAFRHSRWFSRGWTLQELLAPMRVEFFSKEGTMLGDKSGLATKISAITGVPVDALHGRDLSTFSREERFAWARDRQTKYEEDLVYSLLGIFDVTMPLVYGEGEARARKRLMKELPWQLTRYMKPVPILIYLSIFVLYVAIVLPLDYPELAWKLRSPFSPLSVDSLSPPPHAWNILALPFARTPPRPWLIPYLRPSSFSGRLDQLSELEAFILGNYSTRFAIYGPSGCGKTALALELAYRMREEQPQLAIFWVSALTQTTFETGYQDMRDLLRMSKHWDANLLVKSKLDSQSSGPWLLIIDNVDDAKVLFDPLPNSRVRLFDYLPYKETPGSVVFTTASQEIALALADSTIALDKLPKSEAEALLRDRLVAGQHYDPTRPDIIEQFLLTLQHFPLAITQAFALIKASNTSISEYMVHYQQNGTLTKEQLKIVESPQVVSQAVISTCQLSLLYLQEHKKLALEYLLFAVLLDFGMVYEGLLPAAVQPVIKQEAMEILKSLGFFTEVKRRDGHLRDQQSPFFDDEQYEIHPLTRLAVVRWLEDTEQLLQWKTKAISYLNEVQVALFSRPPWEE